MPRNVILSAGGCVLTVFFVVVVAGSTLAFWGMP